jgi:UDP-glucose 4-epimerase
LRVTTIRLFNTVGPRQSGQYGMVIPRFIKAAIDNQPLEVYGDGQQTRVFCHIYDTVKAILDLGASNLTVGEVFNVGGVEEISIYNLAEKIIKVLNANSTIKLIAYNKAYDLGFEDMQKRVPNIDKILKFIKWVPRRNLNDIITDVAKNISKET